MFSRHPASDSSKLHQFVSFDVESIPFLCLKLYSLNFAIAHAQKDCYAYQNSSYLCCINTQENCIITSSEINFEFIKFVKKEKCLPLTKTNRFGNLRFITIFDNSLPFA